MQMKRKVKANLKRLAQQTRLTTVLKDNVNKIEGNVLVNWNEIRF